MLKSKLPKFSLKGKRVFVRADLNVPLAGNTVGNDFRLLKLEPTLQHILAQGSNIVLASHLGRPEKPTPSLSLINIMPWFTKRGYDVEFCPDIQALHTKIDEQKNQGSILLLENLRFFSGEKAQDRFFAKELAYGCDYYVNDAFGALHRHDASITLTPTFFDREHITIGFLVEKELEILTHLYKNPLHPYVLIVGGGKIKDKIELIQQCLSTVNAIVLCPALVFTFMASRGIRIGQSLIDETLIQKCRTIEQEAHEKNVQLIFPPDFQIIQTEAEKCMPLDPHTIDETQLYECKADKIPDNAIGINIGTQSIEQIRSLMQNAKTIFFNAAMGWPSKPATQKGTHALLQAMTNCQAFTVVGGGDSIQAAFDSHVQEKISFLSTGGGATLAFLSGKSLPGLQPFTP